jgi:hypothetical protein
VRHFSQLDVEEVWGGGGRTNDGRWGGMAARVPPQWRAGSGQGQRGGHGRIMKMTRAVKDGGSGGDGHVWRRMEGSR